MVFQKGYYYRDGKRALSKAARRQKRLDAKIREISEVWHATKHLYDYDNPPLNKYTAEQRGWDIYWAICKYGHVGERSVKNSYCKTCEKINRSIRDARTRGALAIALSREEKDQIAVLYKEAQSLSVKTGKPHHVDHIRPLAAGGLHHPDNLRVISAEENLAKGALYKGKRRKYSRREKKEAREQFKYGLTGNGNENEIRETKGIETRGIEQGVFFILSVVFIFLSADRWGAITLVGFVAIPLFVLRWNK